MAPKVALIMMLACMVLAAPYADALTCNQILSGLSPCFTYLRFGGYVPPSCCSAVKSINSAAKTTPDRQAACKCIKGAAGWFNPSFASNLPGKCGVNVGYPISLSVDCSKVK